MATHENPRPPTIETADRSRSQGCEHYMAVRLSRQSAQSSNVRISAGIHVTLCDAALSMQSGIHLGGVAGYVKLYEVSAVSRRPSSQESQ